MTYNINTSPSKLPSRRCSKYPRRNAEQFTFTECTDFFHQQRQVPTKDKAQQLITMDMSVRSDHTCERSQLHVLTKKRNNSFWLHNTLHPDDRICPLRDDSDFHRHFFWHGDLLKTPRYFCSRGVKTYSFVKNVSERKYCDFEQLQTGHRDPKSTISSREFSQRLQRNARYSPLWTCKWLQ